MGKDETGVKQPDSAEGPLTLTLEDGSVVRAWPKDVARYGTDGFSVLRRAEMLYARVVEIHGRLDGKTSPSEAVEPEAPRCVNCGAEKRPPKCYACFQEQPAGDVQGEPDAAELVLCLVWGFVQGLGNKLPDLMSAKVFPALEYLNTRVAKINARLPK